MTKEEALDAWEAVTKHLEDVKARHKRELAQAKAEFAAARDAFIAASVVGRDNQQLKREG